MQPNQVKDYRESHLDHEHATSYNAKFHDNPHRRMIWDFEKLILKNILVKYYREVKIDHLDFACGTGRLLGYLCQYTSHSVGVEVSKNMIKIARENGITNEIIVADLTKNDVLEGRRFNLVTAFRFFPNAQPELQKSVMRIIALHLENGGYLVFNNHKNARPMSKYLRKILNRQAGMRMNVRDMKDLAGEAGLETIKVYFASILPVSESHILFPASILRILEMALRKFPFIRRVGQDAIFVCRKASS